MKVKVIIGKNGNKALRIDGDAVMFPVWNSKTGEEMPVNELVERIGLCLSFCEGYTDEELGVLRTLEQCIDEYIDPHKEQDPLM